MKVIDFFLEKVIILLFCQKIKTFPFFSRSLLGHLSIAHKDSGVPPPPPPPSATFPVAAVTSSSTLLTSPAVINESSMSNHNSTSSTTSVTSLTPPGPMNVSTLDYWLKVIACFTQNLFHRPF